MNACLGQTADYGSSLSLVNCLRPGPSAFLFFCSIDSDWRVDINSLGFQLCRAGLQQSLYTSWYTASNFSGSINVQISFLAHTRVHTCLKWFSITRVYSFFAELRKSFLLESENTQACRKVVTDDKSLKWNWKVRNDWIS